MEENFVVQDDVFVSQLEANLKYYPSGHIKDYIEDYNDNYSNKHYDDLPVDFKELKKSIEVIEEALERYISTNDKTELSYMVIILARELDVDMQIFMYDKTLSTKEKEKLKKYREITQHYIEVWESFDEDY